MHTRLATASCARMRILLTASPYGLEGIETCSLACALNSLFARLWWMRARVPPCVKKWGATHDRMCT